MGAPCTQQCCCAHGRVAVGVVVVNTGVVVLVVAAVLAFELRWMVGVPRD